MLERKIMQKLTEWKQSKNKKCLIIEGARQVGKTYIIREFGKRNYEKVVEINFFEHPEYLEIFNSSLNGIDIESQIRLRVLGAGDMNPENTLIFLDEIQECPNAITALKFLTIDGRYDIIVSGSLLGIHYKEVSSYPVGYVEHLEMNSLDFEEFLWAIGISKDSINDLKKYFDDLKEIPLSMHNAMLDYFKKYIVVGGMPEVVNAFIKDKNYNNVLKLQRDIIKKYEDDIQKYASFNDKSKIRACFRSIPKNLAQDYKKFRYSLVEKNASSRKYASSLEWLYDAGIINFCYNLRIPELPLDGNSDSDTFKIYMKDTGLLVSMLEDGSQIDILDGNLGIYKGAIYENIIADIFAKLGKKLYYFEKNSTLEIDFFIRYEGEATAVEVKSADNTKSKSLTSVYDNYNVKKGIKLSTKNIGKNDKTLSIPLYMAMFLNNVNKND